MKTHTDSELKQIAIDLYDGKIFSDRHVENPEDILSVFMLLPLGAFKDMSEEEIKDIGMVYEYMEKAGPLAINGMPSFLSLRLLNKEDCKKVFKYYDEYKNIKEEFIKEKIHG